MLRPGETVPDALVWRVPREEVRLPALAREGPLLLLFYQFAWTST